MNLHEMAFQIYLKKLPSSYCTEQTKSIFITTAEQAYEMANVFYDELKKQEGPIECEPNDTGMAF